MPPTATIPSQSKTAVTVLGRGMVGIYAHPPGMGPASIGVSAKENLLGVINQLKLNGIEKIMFFCAETTKEHALIASVCHAIGQAHVPIECFTTQTYYSKEGIAEVFHKASKLGIPGPGTKDTPQALMRAVAAITYKECVDAAA